MIRVSRILFWFGLTLAASLMLYQTSDRVHELDQELRNVNTAIEQEQQSLHVLKAEWVYLANPTRVETLTKKYLALRPTGTQKIIRLADLDVLLPSRSEAVARVAVTSTPIASINTGKRPAVQMASSHDNSGHINDHMIMQRTASAQPLPNSIGTLIAELGTHP